MWKLVSNLLKACLLLACGLVSGLWALQQLSGADGLTEVGDDEIAIVYNQWSDSAVEVDSPGTEVFLPYVERVYVMKRAGAPLLMQGAGVEAGLHVPELRLRTSDGSVIHFGSVVVRTSLMSGQARNALEDRNGEDQPNLDLIEAYLRAIAHDEYGRYQAEELLRGENQSRARERTLARLRDALAPHGVAVELSMPDLQFDSTYEKSLEDRRLAYQEVERLKAEFVQLEAERDLRLAALEKVKLIELNKTEIQIREYLAKIESTSKSRRAAALQYQQDRRAEATNRKYQLDGQAVTLAEEIALRAEVFRQEVEPLQLAGSALAREAWIEGLKQTPLRLQPVREREPSTKKTLQHYTSASL